MLLPLLFVAAETGTGEASSTATGDEAPEQTGLPLVSVIVLTFRREAFLRHTMTALASQTYAHLEIVVVNDGPALPPGFFAPHPRLEVREHVVRARPDLEAGEVGDALAPRLRDGRVHEVLEYADLSGRDWVVDDALEGARGEFRGALRHRNRRRTTRSHVA